MNIKQIDKMSTVSTLVILDISKIHIHIIKNHEAEFKPVIDDVYNIGNSN